MTLNRQVVIRRRGEASDALGQPTEAWETFATCWAEIRHPSGVEQIKAGAEVSTVRASIRVRRRDGITPAMQVVHGATVYSILAVLPDEMDRLYIFLACEVTA